MDFQRKNIIEEVLIIPTDFRDDLLFVELYKKQKV